MLRFLTAGESHGKALVAIIEGFPAGVPLAARDLELELKRRQRGYGRGERQEIEDDRAEILSGVRGGETLGSPIALRIDNLDWKNWQELMSSTDRPDKSERITRPRPGHADLPGALKYDRDDIRDVLERASARETAARTAVGAVCKKLLKELNISLISHVIEIGNAGWGGFSPEPHPHMEETDDVACECFLPGQHPRIDLPQLMERIENSPVRCLDNEVGEKMMLEIDRAREEGDTLGGVFEILAMGIPPGLGSHVHWDRRLEGRLASSLMPLNGIKAVEIGLGREAARRPGSMVHDEIRLKEGRICRPTNRAGGLEGGITTGEPLLIRASQKPISTLRRSLTSVDLERMTEVQAHHERSDVCAVPAAAVIGEAVVSIVLAQAILEKFGGDSLAEIKDRLSRYCERLAARGWTPWYQR